jgi:hypothetical protein
MKELNEQSAKKNYSHSERTHTPQRFTPDILRVLSSNHAKTPDRESLIIRNFAVVAKKYQVAKYFLPLTDA